MLRFLLPGLLLTTVFAAPCVAQDSASLDQALAYVYVHHPVLDAERRTLSSEDEHIDQAYSGFRPQVSASGDVGRQRVSTGAQDWQYGPATTASLNAVQPLFNGFGTLASYRAAQARMRAARAQLQHTEQRVLFDAASAWMGLYASQCTLTLTRDTLTRMRRFHDAVGQRFHAGDATRTDIDQAESRLADAEARSARAEGDWQGARALYERVTGLAAPFAELPHLPTPLPPTPEDAETQARGNAQVLVARELEQAASHDIDTASSSLWPTVSLRGGINQQRSPDLGLARLRDDTITLNVSMPLYQGGAEYSRIREAKLAHEKSRDAEIDATRAAQQEARTAWYDYHAAWRVIDAADQAALSAAHALAGVRQEQMQGTRSLTDVLDAESSLISLQLAAVDAQKNLRLSAYRLLAATGDLTPAHLRLAVTPYDPTPHYNDTAHRIIGF